jgi:hypothetical protein
VAGPSRPRPRLRGRARVDEAPVSRPEAGRLLEDLLPNKCSTKDVTRHRSVSRGDGARCLSGEETRASVAGRSRTRSISTPSTPRDGWSGTPHLWTTTLLDKLVELGYGESHARSSLFAARDYPRFSSWKRNRRGSTWCDADPRGRRGHKA